MAQLVSFMCAVVSQFHGLDFTVTAYSFENFFPLHPMDILLNLFFPVVTL